jgi:NADH-quinone oxidoreductase subunit A
MPMLLVFLLTFTVFGAVFLAVNLLIGWLVRPNRPNPEKLAIYECAEEPIGTAYVQFDLRFYVVALLFVIFDVEMAFLYPWAVVFGSCYQIGNDAVPLPQQQAAVLRLSGPGTPVVVPEAEAAATFAWYAFLELLVFFGILLVGFAYLWRRGDLEWVRSTAAQPSKSTRQISEQSLHPIREHDHATVA